MCMPAPYSLALLCPMSAVYAIKRRSLQILQVVQLHQSQVFQSRCKMLVAQITALRDFPFDAGRK